VAVKKPPSFSPRPRFFPPGGENNNPFLPPPSVYPPLCKKTTQNPPNGVFLTPLPSPPKRGGTNLGEEKKLPGKNRKGPPGKMVHNPQVWGGRQHAPQKCNKGGKRKNGKPWGSPQKISVEKRGPLSAQKRFPGNPFRGWKIPPPVEKSGREKGPQKIAALKMLGANPKALGPNFGKKPPNPAPFWVLFQKSRETNPPPKIFPV